MLKGKEFLQISHCSLHSQCGRKKIHKNRKMWNNLHLLPQLDRILSPRLGTFSELYYQLAREKSSIFIRLLNESRFVDVRLSGRLSLCDVNRVTLATVEKGVFVSQRTWDEGNYNCDL